MIEEHNVALKDQAKGAPGTEWDEVLPPGGHPRLGKELLRIVGEVIKDKQSLGLHDKWMKGYKLSRGKHWEREARSVPQKTANLIHTHLMRSVNTLTDNNPTFNVNQAGEAEDGDAYTKLQLTAEFWWQEQEQQIILEGSVRNGEMYGVTIEKVVFNPELEFEIGEVETIVVDPFHFGVYPVKCSHIQKADVVLHYYPLSVREARRRWPDFKDRIIPDGKFLEELGDERREIAGGGQKGFLQSVSGIFSNLVVSLINKTGGRGGEETGEEETLVVEAWVRDRTVGPDGEALYKGNIRRITACSAGLLIVDDRSNPNISEALPDEMARLTYLYDKFPFSLSNSVAEANYLWGLSDFEQLEILQEEVNKTISQLSFHKDQCVRPKMVNPKDSGVPNEHFTNAIGILNPNTTETAKGIRVLEMQNNMRDILDVFNLYKELFYMVGGTFDLDQAQAPGKSVIAYKAIAALLERAATMMRGKIRNYSKLIRDRGRMYLSHVMNFYTEDRYITYEDHGETHSMAVRGTDLIVPSRLTVVTGSTMPQSKIQQREEALELFNAGAIDREELLEKMDWSGRAAVIKRMEQGPLTDFMERLQLLGIQEELLQVLSEIAELDRKDFDKAIEAGEFPMVALPEIDPSLALALQEKQAQIEKLQAEAAQIAAHIDAKAEEAEVMRAGQQYDREKLEIERVKAIAMIKGQADKTNLQAQAIEQKSQEVPASRSKGHSAPGPERGIKSNNQNKVSTDKLKRPKSEMSQ